MNMDNTAHTIRQLIDSGDLIGAEHALTNALHQNPGSPELLNLQAELLLKLGSDLWEKGEVDRALDYLTRAIEVNPSDRDTVLKCGEVLTSLEQAESARDLYASYLQKNPDDNEITKALRNLPLPATAGETKTPLIPDKIVIAVNLVPFKDPGQLERQKNCIQSISELIPLGIIPLNICYADELMHPDDWEVFPVLSRSADKELKVDGKRKPFVTDLFDAAAEWAGKHNQQWFIITNSDIIFTPEFLQEVANLLELDYDTAAFSRHDIVSIDQESGTATGYVESRGSDVFLCRTSWWKENRNRFQPYIFGERAWDNSFAGVMATHSRFYISFKEGICFHLKHPETWMSGPYADYNMSLFNGVDRKYGNTFFTFLGEAMQLPKETLTVEKTTELIKKYFRPDEAVHKPLKQQTGGLASIVILLSGQSDYFGKCIESIRKHTPEPHEVILVPVESVHTQINLIQKYLDENQHYKLVGNSLHTPASLSRGELKQKPADLSYPEAVNKGIAEAKGEHVVIVNDDVVVTERWLSGMLEHLKSAPDIGIVSPMTVNVDGPQGVRRIESGEWRSEKARSPRHDETVPHDDKQSAVIARSEATKQSHDIEKDEIATPSGLAMTEKEDARDDKEKEGLDAFAKAFRERNR
jgi:tetratricopeptide (TPR) repeat protein